MALTCTAGQITLQEIIAETNNKLMSADYLPTFDNTKAYPAGTLITYGTPPALYVTKTNVSPGAFNPASFVALQNDMLVQLLDVNVSLVQDGHVLAFDSATQKWKNVVAAKGRGVYYDANTAYGSGDIVSYLGLAYICAVPTTGPFAAGNWIPIGLPEKGGVAFDALVEYSIGDIVADGSKAYISLVNNNLGNPVTDIAAWKDANTSLTYISTFAPATGTEYPATPVNDTYYRVDGLIAPYTFTGGDLDTKIAKNGDDMIYVGGSWQLVPGAATIPEQGGILWGSATSYLIGDIVSFGNEVYSAIIDTQNQQPDLAPLSWKKVGGSQSKIDFTSITGQTGFTIPAPVAEPVVFRNGVKVRDTEYTVVPFASTTNIKFSVVQAKDAWINVTY